MELIKRALRVVIDFVNIKWIRAWNFNEKNTILDYRMHYAFTCKMETASLIVLSLATCNGSTRRVCELSRRPAVIGNALVITKKKSKNWNWRCRFLLVKTLMNVARASAACGCHRYSCYHMKLRLYFCARSSVYTGNIKLKLLYCVKAK